MLERPHLLDGSINEALLTHYGISVIEIVFLPLGNDSATSAYRVLTTEGMTYFLKARGRGRFSAPSLDVPRHLHDLGLPHIVAPLPTVRQALSVAVAGYTLSLYPFIDGRVGAKARLSEQHWHQFGALVRQVHDCQLPKGLLEIVPRETFVPNQRSAIDQLQAAVDGQLFRTAEEREFATFWRAQQDLINILLMRTDQLGRRLCQASSPLVLCHADMHVWNLLIDTGRQLWLIDWDETMLALRERDLMFVVGGIGNRIDQWQTTCFLDGYGESVIDQLALAYYRYAWAVQDMAACGEQVFFLPDLSDGARRAALRSFVDLFAPGSIVSLALASQL
jgi:spectinomycin phosphotransferase